MQYQFGSFLLNLDTFELSNDGKKLTLEPKTFDLIVYLIKNHERLVSRQASSLSNPKRWAMGLASVTIIALISLGIFNQSTIQFIDSKPVLSNTKNTFYKIAVLPFSNTHSNPTDYYYLQALNLNPELLPSLSFLSMFYTETNRIEEAFKLAKKMQSINPNNANTHFTLGYIYRYAGMMDIAIKDKVIAESDLQEFGDFLSNGYRHTASAAKLRIFLSSGIGVQDLQIVEAVMQGSEHHRSINHQST